MPAQLAHKHLAAFPATDHASPARFVMGKPLSWLLKMLSRPGLDQIATSVLTPARIEVLIELVDDDDRTLADRSWLRVRIEGGDSRVGTLPNRCR